MRALIFPVIIATLLLASCSTKKTFTMQDFDKVETGTTITEAEQVTGFKAKKVSESVTKSGSKKSVTEAYVFSNPDGSNAFVILENGKIIKKTQTKLQ